MGPLRGRIPTDSTGGCWVGRGGVFNNGLKASSHGFNVTGRSRHAPTLGTTGSSIVQDTYYTFYLREKGRDGTRRRGRERERGR